MHDREKVIDQLSTLKIILQLQKDVLGYGYYIEFLDDAIELLKEQEQTIERLEHDLAITENNLNYYINGND